jgi:hypothetical protein
MTADEARLYLKRLSSHPGRAGDTDNLNPEFAIRLATAIQQARAEGIPASLASGYRDENQTGSTYDAKGDSSHSYGLASDIGGLDGPGGALTNRWAQIAQANGISNPYGTGNAAEFNHWQLPAQPLEQTSALLNSLKAAKATGDMNQVWAAYSPGSVGGGQKSWTADQVFNAIYQQESGGGTNPAAGNNVMQIQPGTWKIYAQPGEDINDRAANIAVGHRIVNDLMEKFNNDPSRVAVAYFSGEGNVAKDGATPYLKDSNDGSKAVSGYVSDIMRRLGAPQGGGGSTAPVASPQTPAQASPWAVLGSSLGEALGQMSNAESASTMVSDPPDAPPIRTPALGADFMAPPASPVPQTLAGGIAPTLGSLAVQPQTEPIQDPSITQGAPSMTAMLGGVGTSTDPTLVDPRRTGSINPYTRPLTRLG